MDKLIKIGVVLACVTSAQAGGMGDVAPCNKVVKFISGEAGYNWIPFNGVNINGFRSTNTNQGWGGRLGAGLMQDYRDNFGFSGEMGYGYYGKVNIRFPNNVQRGSFYLDGLDLLAGAYYAYKQVDIFFKAGAMVQNRRSSGTQNNALDVNGSVVTGTRKGNINNSQVLPEIKVGGLYNYNDLVSLSLSYMRVFGSTISGSSNKSFTASPASLTSNTSVHLQNPTINAIMFGLQLNFA